MKKTLLSPTLTLLSIYFCVLGCVGSSCFGAECPEWSRYDIDPANLQSDGTVFFSCSLCSWHNNSDVVISSTLATKERRLVTMLGLHVGTQMVSLFMSLLMMPAHRTDRYSWRQSVHHIFMDCKLFWVPFPFENVALFTVRPTLHTNPSRKRSFTKTMTSQEARDFPARVFLKHKSGVTGDVNVSASSGIVLHPFT